MLLKFIRYFGLLFIVSFSVFSVFVSLMERGLEEGKWKDLISYTTFFEDRFYDIRMAQTLDPEARDNRLVMADIDDYSLQNLDQWPVDRDTWTKMIRKLKDYGAKVIAFDVFFAENVKVCDGVSPDHEMAKSIAEFQSIPGNKVILPYSLDTQGVDYFKEMPDALYNFIMDSKEQGGYLTKSVVSKAVYPINTLLEADPELGHIQVTADSDGVMRHYKAVGNIEGIFLPSYALASYKAYTQKPVILEVDNTGNRLKVGGKTLPLNEKGETKVRWIGGANSFPRVPIYDIIKAKDDDPKLKKLFNNTIVFVGASAYGAYDLRHTPVDPMLPGVYFHMNMAHMLLDGYFYRPQNESAKYSWIILISGTMIMIIVMLFGHAILDLLTMLILSGGLYLIDTYYLLPQGHEIKLFFCLFSIVSTYSWNTLFQFYMANKDKAFLKSAFGNYISPELIDKMYETGEAPKLGGDSGIRTAFFTDIQSFSTFSEKLTATQLVELLNEYLTAMTDILLEEGGTLDKYEGDAIIAFFGAPMPMEDHATRACIVAHRMQKKLLELRKKWTSEGDKWPEIVHLMRMRVGINSGEIVTGNMGSASRMNYTMMGDSVNLAARLEEAAKQYGIFTQISKMTVDLIEPNVLVFRELDTIKVVGKSEPVTTYELIGKEGELTEIEIKLKELFEKGISLYKDRKWDEAIKTFSESLELENQREPELIEKVNPSKIYIERCEIYKENPPAEDWDGSFTLTKK